MISSQSRLDQVVQAYYNAIYSGIAPKLIYAIEGCGFFLDVQVVSTGCHFRGACNNTQISILMHIGRNFKQKRSSKWVASLRGVIAHEICHLDQNSSYDHLPFYDNVVTVRTVIDYFRSPWELSAFEVGISERSRCLGLNPVEGFHSWWSDCVMYWLKQGNLSRNDILKVKRSIQQMYIEALRK